MNVSTTQPFIEFQAGINEATAELDKLVQYCRDTMATDPSAALGTVQDMEGQIQEAADLIRGRVAIFKRAARRL
ncbi:MAG: hypothetical protein AB7D27_02950 [Desulfomicrobium sp.]|jgi:hypothetical protein